MVGATVAALLLKSSECHASASRYLISCLDVVYAAPIHHENLRDATRFDLKPILVERTGCIERKETFNYQLCVNCTTSRHEFMSDL